MNSQPYLGESQPKKICGIVGTRNWEIKSHNKNYRTEEISQKKGALRQN